MTNETTARQPKSIGDDAQFRNLLFAYLNVGTTRQQHDVYSKIIAHIDSRAPAAQASATIQAEGGVDWLGLALALEDRAKTVESQTTERAMAAAARGLRLMGAATIQQHVMVAEPVELVGIAEQIKEGAGFWHSCSGCYDTEDGHPTGPYAYSHAMRCALGNGCAECGGLGARWDNNDYSEPAAPMVADPAGVAKSAAERRHAERIDNMHSGVVGVFAAIKAEHLAATVKAVPSEALDAARYRWLRDKSEPGICAFYMSVGKAFDGVKFTQTTVDEAIDAQIAAPLADKTGGGE